MTFYAQVAAHRTRQIVGDVVVVVLLVLALVLALEVRQAVLSLGAAGEQLVSAGTRLEGAFDDAAGAAGDIPLVGDTVAGGLRPGAEAGAGVAAAGQAQVDAVEAVANWTAVVIVGLPAVLLLLIWLPLRLRLARRAAMALALADSGQEDLLALRALTRLSPQRLADVCHDVAGDPAAAWRRGDPELIRVLSAEELRSLGVRR